jgi:exopolyphosphatase/guanosine-5'-triphosphate,3'-diphosphate pyrophosphatase
MTRPLPRPSRHYDPPALRVAAIDMGTNSTRLLVADVNGEVEAIRRESRVTGLGRGVETSGQLATDAIENVFEAVGDYAEEARRLGAEDVFAFATSAVRDASNGDAFLAELRERFSLRAKVLAGSEEARMTYRGALSGREVEGETLVVDIGGGSTELIVGSGQEPTFHTSLQMGVVRHSERHVHADPPRTEELEALSEDVGSTLDSELSAHPGLSAQRAIAVAGTPATLAAIDLGLEHFDADRVEGHRLSLRSAQQSCSRLASASLDQRRLMTGVHPDRAPTIVAGVVILIRAMRAFGLEQVEVSDRDILYGAALTVADGA